ncbi:MAG: alpha/beta fold hydrolase [Alphaproteobacteria bacterium]
MSEESAVWYSSLDGLSLFARRLGASSRRAALLCLHDVAQTSRSFIPLAHEVASVRNVLIPDLRGHGRSDYPFDLKTYSIAMLAEDAAALLAIEEVDAAIVVGSGFGGIVALQLAALRPKAVTAVVLCECSPDLLPETITQEALRAELAASLGAWAQAERALHGARLILRDEEGRPHEDWDPAAAPRLAHSLAQTKCWPLFEAAHGKPMLAIRGGASAKTSAADFEAMARCNTALKVVTIPNAADARHFDQPEILRPIIGFLTSLP